MPQFEGEKKFLSKKEKNFELMKKTKLCLPFFLEMFKNISKKLYLMIRCAFYPARMSAA